MRLVWTRRARQDLSDIIDHIAADDPSAASRMDDLIEAAVDRLIDFPLLGRPGAAPGTRELTPHRSYRLIYGIEDEMVVIMAVIHTARLWPPAGE